MIAMPNARQPLVTVERILTSPWLRFLAALSKAPGPYLDDAAAAAAGLSIGDQYLRSDGVVAWRVA